MAKTQNSLLKRLEREARDLRAKENWDERAIAVNSRILELDPENVTALCRRARCYKEQEAFPRHRLTICARSG